MRSGAGRRAPTPARARVAALVVCVALVGCGPRSAGPARDTLPAGPTVQSEAGEPIDLAATYRGRVLVLDFWAGWCQRCEASIPRVRRLAAAFAHQGLVVIGVNASEKPAAARQAALDFGIDYPIVLDPTFAFATSMGATGLPQVLVIDRDGAVAHRASEIDEATLAVVRRLLE